MSTLRFSVLLAAAALIACSDGDGPVGPPPPPPPPIGIAPNPVSLSVGEIVPLKATGMGTMLVVIWSTDDPSVASVATGGLLRGVKSGITTVHARAGTASAATLVTVR